MMSGSTQRNGSTCKQQPYSRCQMNAMALSLLALVFCVCGTHCGMYIRAKLPDHHLTAESRELVKLGAGLIATLTALVLGLLVSSAKDTLDTMNKELIRDGAKIIQLDRALAHYGSDAAEFRTFLQQSVRASLQQYWHEDLSKEALLQDVGNALALEKLQAGLRALSPRSDNERQLLSGAQQLCSDLIQSRWLMIEMAERELPQAFLVVVMLWLTVLYVCYGLITPQNGTVKVVLFVSALSIAGAIFLILEMNVPLSGIIKVSSAPLQKALSMLGK
jgi:hypothetical protein